MADKDREEDLSLQLPSFGFGRKKTKDEPRGPKAAPTGDAAPTQADSAPATVVPEPPRAVERQRVERTDPYVKPAGASPSTQTQQLPVEDEPSRELSFPVIGALQAVLVVGAIIGILAVLLTFASLKFCELVGGTDSCGGPGLLLLVAIVVLLTYVGGWLLRGLGVDDPGSTSFLAVALLVVMTMVFFLSWIYSWWMILVIPPVSMAMFALSWWVTTSFVDTDDGRS